MNHWDSFSSSLLASFLHDKHFNIILGVIFSHLSAWFSVRRLGIIDIQIFRKLYKVQYQQNSFRRLGRSLRPFLNMSNIYFCFSFEKLTSLRCVFCRIFVKYLNYVDFFQSVVGVSLESDFKAMHNSDRQRLQLEHRYIYMLNSYSKNDPQL